MIAFEDQGTLRISPSNEDEAVLLDKWLHQTPKVSGSQRTMEGRLSSITLIFTNE